MIRFAAFFFLLLATCCSTPPPPPATLKISFNTSPATSDPRKCADFVSSTLVCLIYEGLSRCVADGDVELALAEKVDLSPDGKIYTFHLRKSHWTDGKPVTAYDFEASWKKILDPAYPSICAYLLYPIKNAEACAKGNAPLSEAGICALGPQILRVELERPTPYFLSLTAFPLLLPYPSHIQEDLPIPVTNGPFKVENHAANSEIVLTKNPGFWNPGEVRLDQIHIAIVPDESTAYQMFERGELDWLGGPLAPIPPDALESLLGRASIRFIPMAATTFCSFNTETLPFSNIHLRKAFSLAIDRGEIVREVTQAGQIPATRPLPPSLFGNEPKELIPAFSPELARGHLEKGLEMTGLSLSDLSGIVLYYRHGQIDKRLAQALQKQWKQTLGVAVALEQAEQKSHLQRLQKRDYQISLASWIAQVHDPINLLERFRERCNPKNYAGWEHPEFARLLEASQKTAGLAKRRALLEHAEALFAEEMPLAPIYHWSQPTIAGPRIAEVPANLSGAVLFEKMELKNPL